MKSKVKILTAHLSIVLLFAAIGLISCDGKKSPGYEYKGKPKETITIKQAQAMYQAYQARFDALTEFRQGNEDARYGWHDLDFYKNYIAYLEHEAAKVGKKVSGIRLYYVAYPDNDSIVNTDQNGYQTYLYVPTYFDEKLGKHIAFDPLHMDENGEPVRMHDVITKGMPVGKNTLGLAGFTSVALADEESSSANMSQMCRPNCSE